MKKRLTKTAVLILAILLISMVLPITASADMGPKDALTVTVVNPPPEPYYLDLLTQDKSTGNHDNLNGARDKLDQNMLQLLYSKSSQGWWPALAGGTNAPLFGKLTGDPKGETMVHSFSYFGVPDTYRIIIVTQSLKVSVTEAHTRENMQSSVTYDYKTGMLTVAPFWGWPLVLQLSTTLIATLVLEGLLLLLFGFKLRENWRVFLITNIITQILLTLSTSYMSYMYGVIALIFIFMVAEFLIIVAETLVYAKLLKGRKTSRRVAYAITANLVSLIAGIVVMALTAG